MMKSIKEKSINWIFDWKDTITYIIIVGIISEISCKGSRLAYSLHNCIVLSARGKKIEPLLDCFMQRKGVEKEKSYQEIVKVVLEAKQEIALLSLQLLPVAIVQGVPSILTQPVEG